MYIIEHALRNIIKSKGRNMLLGAAIFAIITAASVSMAIYNTSGHIISETLDALKCAVRAAPRMQSITGQGRAGAGNGAAGGGTAGAAGAAGAADAGPAVSLDMYLLFAQSDYLDGADIKEGGRGADGVDAVYYLKQPHMLAAFEAEMRAKGLPDDYVVRTDESAFESVAGPVESLAGLALIFLVAVLILGAAIMALLSAIAVRERKYEVGVLRAMGMKKGSVALGLWVEIIAITCICYAFGMLAGAALSQPVSDSMMSWQARPPSPQSSSLADRMGEQGEAGGQDGNGGSGGSIGGNGGDIAAAGSIDVAMSGATALEILAIAILLASIAGAVSAALITRSEPIKILMERD